MSQENSNQPNENVNDTYFSGIIRRLEAQEKIVAEHTEQLDAMRRQEAVIEELQNRLNTEKEKSRLLEGRFKRLRGEHGKLKNEVTVLQSWRSDRWLVLKLIGQLFVPPTFIPDAENTVNNSSDASDDESQISDMVQNFVSGRLDQYLRSFEQHISEELEDVRKRFKDTEELGAKFSQLEQRYSELDSEQKTLTEENQNCIKQLKARLQKALQDIDTLENELKNQKNIVSDTLISAENRESNLKLAVDRELDAITKKLVSTIKKITEDFNSQISGVTIGMQQNEKYINEVKNHLQKLANDSRDMHNATESALAGISEKSDAADALINALTQKYTNDNIKITNQAKAMFTELGRLCEDIYQEEIYVEEPEFESWAFNYFAARLKNDPELPVYKSDEGNEHVQNVKKLVNEFLSEYDCMDLCRKTENCSFASCLIIPKEGETYNPDIHSVKGFVKPDKSGKSIIESVFVPGLMIPSNPKKNIKAYVSLKGKEIEGSPEESQTMG